MKIDRIINLAENSKKQGVVQKGDLTRAKIARNANEAFNLFKEMENQDLGYIEELETTRKGHQFTFFDYQE